MVLLVLDLNLFQLFEAVFSLLSNSSNMTTGKCQHRLVAKRQSKDKGLQPMIF